jgi:SAM-dependent methyltransferase
VTKEHLRLYGLKSTLRRVDAERLPFKSEFFDVVYSWGVIHHSEKPELIIAEIKRVLKPGGIFIGMMYGRHSVVAFKYWLKHGLFKGRPWRTFTDVLWNHFESIGTKAYTMSELKKMFSDFKKFDGQPIITWHDVSKWPGRISSLFPDKWGWFITLKAIK